MALEILLVVSWLIVTVGILLSGTRNRDTVDLISCAIFWPIMLAFALLIGCFFAVLVYLKIILVAFDHFFGVVRYTGRR